MTRPKEYYPCILAIVSIGIDVFYRIVTMKPSELHEAIKCLHATLSQNLPTYVHCLAGMERSPTVCVRIPCIYENMPLGEALNWVKQCNPRTNITHEQLQVIQQVIQQQT